LSFLTLLINKDGRLAIDADDEIIKATLLTRDGAVVNAALAHPHEAAAANPASPPDD
jgi:NAD(P) transhydrogenase subunit alpha